MSLVTWIVLALVGGVGALMRFRIDGSISARRAGAFPLGTFAINIGGAFCLGLLTGASVTGTWLFIAGTGLLGSFTTFSTWVFETERLAEDGEETVAVANLGLSMAAGLVAAAAGWAIGAVL
ncbi:MAG TPA: fluoride efflux transporter CrcB [Gaiellaceae bacterium]|nr:fluoride efflux transporter CrcB [Gaiellaceae bacterium]